MPQFYVAPENIRGKAFTLGAAEAAHIVRVCRLRPGETIRIFDGLGKVYRALLSGAAGGSILESLPAPEPSFKINLCFSLLARAGTEALLERCCAAGVDSFQPVVSSRTQETRADWERRSVRFRNIFISACSQSFRPRLPELFAPVRFSEFLSAGCPAVICDFGGMKLPELSRRLGSSEKINLFVGPEGGFTAGEISAALGAGALTFSLGNYVLRAEDAAFAASAALMMGK